VLAVLAVDQSRLSSMFVFFFIALLIVSPFGYRQVRSVLADRRARFAPGVDDSTPADLGASSSATGGPDLAAVVAAIAEAAAELGSGDGHDRTIAVPADVTVEGRPATDAVVEALVADAARRSGLRHRWGVGADGERTVTVDVP